MRTKSSSTLSPDVIQRGTKQTHSSVEMTDAAGETLARIVDAATTINDLNGQIATASDKQTNVAGEIDRRIISITDLAKKPLAKPNPTPTK